MNRTERGSATRSNFVRHIVDETNGNAFESGACCGSQSRAPVQGVQSANPLSAAFALLRRAAPAFPSIHMEEREWWRLCCVGYIDVHPWFLTPTAGRRCCGMNAAFRSFRLHQSGSIPIVPTHQITYSLQSSGLLVITITIRPGTLAGLLAGTLFGSLLLLLASPASALPAFSAKSGPWSAPTTWEGGFVPRGGAQVLIRSGHRVVYDVESDDTIRGINVAGTLAFSRERNTRLNVGLIKIQHGNGYSEEGFACDAHLPDLKNDLPLPSLEIGTQQQPIPAGITAHLRLVFIDGMDEKSCPAIVACRTRMEIHGAPMNRTWVKLGKTADKGTAEITLHESVTGWRKSDRVILTATSRTGYGKGYQTEERSILAIKDNVITLDAPLEYPHKGEGEYRGEVANLSRNVVIESANPEGVRGHTMYHRGSSGGISYAEFRHLGKPGILGRYSIHFHLVGDTMRGSSVIGASIRDSGNRWITIHGTQYLVVRDCIGYGSTGHGFFLEDGTEVYNVLDRNLGVQARRGSRLPGQVLPFDNNQGAAFWWASSLNSFTRNVSVENARYGYRYEATPGRSTSLELPIRQPDGTRKVTDIRTLPFIRFDSNEAHSEAGLYAFNLGEGVQRIGPDENHPFIVRDFKAWNVHYAFRPQAPSLLVEKLHIHSAAYGVYHPNFDRHVYRDVLISDTGAEPFNRGHDDDSIQYGSVSVDGIQFDGIYGARMPLIQLSDNNASGTAESHFRNVKITNWRGTRTRERSLVNRGGGPRPKPKTPTGVPIYLHNWFGSKNTAKIVSTAALDFGADGLDYRREQELTGDEARVAEMKNVAWPRLLNPIDDLPPATVITHVQNDGDVIHVRGTSADNSNLARVTVNGRTATLLASTFGEWKISLPLPANGKLTAQAEDTAGNRELTPHELQLR